MNRTARALAVGAFFGLVAVAGCGGGKADADSGPQAAGEATGAGSPAAEVTADARQEAQQIFSTRCAACHGAQGYGDGPGAAGLDPKPRNYHDTAWQDSVTDAEIESVIVYGGAAAGRSPMMVGNPDLGAKPDVVAALREIIRAFGKQR